MRGIDHLLKSKRAEGEEGEGIVMTSKWAMYMIMAIVIPLLGMIFAMFVTGYQVEENSYLGDVENTVIQSRFFSSPMCFAYQDAVTGRTYPGIIDASRFTQPIMDSCYNAQDSFFYGCFRLELDNIDADPANQKIGVVESKNFGKCLLSKRMKKEPYYVVIKSGAGEFAGILFVESNN